MKVLGQIFISILRPFMSVWLRYLTNCKVIKPPPSGLKPPYLILSTHVSVFEMPYLLMTIRPNPVIVLHELHLVDKLFMMLLSMVGPVWRMQGLPDARTVRQMKRAVRAGRSVLIYPEGDLNWNGDSQPLDLGMARVARFIGAPVLVYRTKGSYMAFPRWAHRARRGRVDMEYELAVKAEDFAKLTDEQVLEKLNAAFNHSERRWHYEGEGKGQQFTSSKPALGIERLLFMCPSCGKDSCMKSDNTGIMCSECGFRADVDANLAVKSSSNLKFKDIWEWHDWQTNEWDKQVGAALLDKSLHLESTPCDAEIVRIYPVPESDKGAPGEQGFPHRILKMPEKFDSALAFLGADGVTVIAKDGRVSLFVPMDDIKSVQVFIIGIYKPNWLIMMTDEAYINIQLVGSGNPCYPWLLAIKKAIAQRSA